MLPSSQMITSVFYVRCYDLATEGNNVILDDDIYFSWKFNLLNRNNQIIISDCNNQMKPSDDNVS